MYSLLIFLIFVFPIALKGYLRNNEFSFIIRVLNISLSFTLFALFFSQFRIMLWGVYKDGFQTLWGEEAYYPFQLIYFQIIELFYFVSCFLISALSIGLGLGKKYSRQLLLRTIPVIWLVLIGHFFKLYFTTNKGEYTNLLAIGITSGIVIGVFLGIIYLFLSSKKVKKLYINP